MPRSITNNTEMHRQPKGVGLGPSAAAGKFGFSRQRYFQLKQAFAAYGATALACKLTGPKHHCQRWIGSRPER